MLTIYSVTAADLIDFAESAADVGDVDMAKTARRAARAIDTSGGYATPEVALCVEFINALGDDQ